MQRMLCVVQRPELDAHLRQSCVASLSDVPATAAPGTGYATFSRVLRASVYFLVGESCSTDGDGNGYPYCHGALGLCAHRSSPVIVD